MCWLRQPLRRIPHPQRPGTGKRKRNPLSIVLSAQEINLELFIVPPPLIARGSIAGESDVSLRYLAILSGSIVTNKGRIPIGSSLINAWWRATFYLIDRSRVSRRQRKHNFSSLEVIRTFPHQLSRLITQTVVVASLDLRGDTFSRWRRAHRATSAVLSVLKR